MSLKIVHSNVNNPKFIRARSLNEIARELSEDAKFIQFIRKNTKSF